MHISEVKPISNIVETRGLLLDPAAPLSTDQYKLINYLPLGSSQYIALLDRQVVSYLITILRSKDLRREPAESILRETAALQAFLIVTNTISEPGPSYNEYADTQGLDKADRELSLFRSADNVDFEIYKGIALGKVHFIPDSEIIEFPDGDIKAAEKNEKVMAFEYNLTIVKKAIVIKRTKNSGFDSIMELLNWMHDDYITTTSSILFFVIFFSNHPIPKMVKGGSEKSARNAAWDLCLLEQWRRSKSSLPANRIFLSSFDRALKAVALLMFPSSSESDEKYFTRLNTEFTRLYGKSGDRGQRVYERFRRLLQESDDSSRVHNQPGNKYSHNFILSVRRQIDEEFR